MKEFIDLNEFRPKHHPLKKEIKNAGVTVAVLGNYLGLSYSYTNNLLSGIHKLPAKHEKSILALLANLKAQAST